MKQISHALLGWLLIIVALAGCGAGMVDGNCPANAGTAVVVYLSDEQQQPLAGVTLRYRHNNRAWQQVDPPVDGETSLGNQAGRYRLRAEKEGYEPAEAVLNVVRSTSGASGGCRLETAQATLQLARRCEQPEEQLEFLATFSGPALAGVDGQSWPPGDLELSYSFPDSSWQAAQCRPATGPGVYNCSLRSDGQELPAAVTFMGRRPGYPNVLVNQTLSRNATGCLYLAAPLQLASSESCAEESRALHFTLKSTAVALPPDLSVTVLKAGSGQSQPVQCHASAANERRCALDLTLNGAYRVAIENLPHAAELLINEGVVAYRYEGYDIELSHGRSQRSVSGAGAGSVTLDFTTTTDEAGCPFVRLSQLTGANAQYSPYADPSLPQTVDLRLQHNLTMTGLNDAACPAETVITPIRYKLLLPPGTPLSETAVSYRYGEVAWQQAECQLRGVDFLCTALLPNPLRAQPLTVKASVRGADTIGMQIPAGNNFCLVFR